jgi:signal transduction histidine kinase
MKLRSHLFILAFGAIAPLAVLAVIAAAWLVEKERETFRVGAEQRALALLTAVDANLKGHLTSVEALAAAPSLRDGDLQYFRRVAEDTMASQAGWLNVRLRLPSGEPLVDLSVPEGQPLASGAPPDDGFQRVVRTRRPDIADPAMDPALKRWQISVRVPVIAGEAVRYVLSAQVAPDSIAAILAAQRLEPGWGAVVLDRSNRFVARTWEPEKYLGQLASQSLRDALAAAPSGSFRGRTVEGVEVYSPYHRSQETGWAVSMGVPASAIDAAAKRTALILASGVLGSIGLAIAGIYLIRQRIADPITVLATAAEAVGRGERGKIPWDIRVDEIRTLAGALHESAQAAYDRQLLIERERNALREADRAKDRFLAMLSHELRNPLAAISAGAHVLKVAGPGSADALQAQLVIERQTMHMAHLVGDLLDISRVIMGKMVLERERLDLEAVVTHLVGIWRNSGRLEHHRVSLETTPAWVDVDRTRIEQIVTNLLDNALKFTPSGGAVRIVVAAEGDKAILRVADDGPGIPAHLLANLFEPFVQGDEPGMRASGGLGVGLALVKGLVEMHGGSVSAENDTRHGGAVLTVRFPAASSVPLPVTEAVARERFQQTVGALK